MNRLEKIFDLKDDILFVNLPQGKTQEELVKQAKEEIKEMENMFYGKDIKINGRITTGMALAIGHLLAHITRSVFIFDPKENKYIEVISH